MIFTSAGTFKLIILRVDAPPHYEVPKSKELPKTIKGTLLWDPGKGNPNEETD
jgi:hypothetical protein